jgi:hypothetical protein
MASVIREAAVQKDVLVMQWSPRQVPSSHWMLASRVRIDLLHFAQSSVDSNSDKCGQRN